LNGSESEPNDLLRKLEERSAAQDRDIAALRKEIARLETSDQRLSAALERLGVVERELSRLKGDFGGLSSAVESAVPSLDRRKTDSGS
jgi:uncharacterized coiled-coil protein SlyX